MKTIFLFILTIYAQIFAQVEADRPKFPYSTSPDFFIDAIPFKSAEPEKCRMDIFIQIPYDNLQFVKNGDKYTAGYSAIITVYDKDQENIINSKSWDQNVMADDFETTSSKSSFSLNLKSFTLVPEEYFLKCQVTDNESGKSYNFENKLFAPVFNDSLSISGILLIQKMVKDNQGKTRIMPNVSGNYSTDMKTLPFLYEINSNTKRRLMITYKIDDQKDKELFSKEFVTNIDSGKNSITQEVDNLDFSLGKFKLTIEVRNEQNELVATVSKSFQSQIFGFPKTIDDLDLAVQQMTYIATPSEMSQIEDADGFEKKMEKYIEFWKKKDPSPNTVENEILNEYYRRVNYADTHFGNYFAGWKSDMGMIYITLGPPSNVERHPFEYDSKPYERWEYYELNKVFVFVDYSGFGDYRLLNPEYGDWMRYRP